MTALAETVKRLRELLYLRSQNAVLRDTCDIQRNRIAELESSLAEARKGARTPTPDALANVLQAYLQFLTIDEAIDAIFHLFNPALAQHPTPSQGTTAEKETDHDQG